LTPGFLRSFTVIAAALSLTACPMLQDRLMFFPSRTSDADVAAIVRSADPRVVRLSEWRVEGEWVGLVAEPAAREVVATALVFHGNAGWAGDRLYYVEPLSNRGIRVVLVEYPGYGPRGGDATIGSARSATDRAIAAAIRRWPAPLVLLGESLGAGLVAELAKKHETQLAGLVLVTPWDSLRNVAKKHYGWLPVDWLLEHPMDSIVALQGFAKPVSVLVAAHDEIVGAAGGEALAEAVGATLVRLAGVGHNDWLLAMTTTQWDALLAPVVASK
jgi:pimeloyl-ACP methyl ester carboxylesterase